MSKAKDFEHDEQEITFKAGGKEVKTTARELKALAEEVGSPDFRISKTEVDRIERERQERQVPLFGEAIGRDAQGHQVRVMICKLLATELESTIKLQKDLDDMPGYNDVHHFIITARVKHDNYGDGKGEDTSFTKNVIYEAVSSDRVPDHMVSLVRDSVDQANKEKKRKTCSLRGWHEPITDHKTKALKCGYCGDLLGE